MFFLFCICRLVVLRVVRGDERGRESKDIYTHSSLSAAFFFSFFLVSRFKTLSVFRFSFNFRFFFSTSLQFLSFTSVSFLSPLLPNSTFHQSLTFKSVSLCYSLVLFQTRLLFQISSTFLQVPSSTTYILLNQIAVFFNRRFFLSLRLKTLSVFLSLSPSDFLTFLYFYFPRLSLTFPLYSPLLQFTSLSSPPNFFSFSFTSDFCNSCLLNTPLLSDFRFRYLQHFFSFPLPQLTFHKIKIVSIKRRLRDVLCA